MQGGHSDWTGKERQVYHTTFGAVKYAAAQSFPRGRPLCAPTHERPRLAHLAPRTPAIEPRLFGMSS